MNDRWFITSRGSCRFLNMIPVSLYQRVRRDRKMSERHPALFFLKKRKHTLPLSLFGRSRDLKIQKNNDIHSAYGYKTLCVPILFYNRLYISNRRFLSSRLMSSTARSLICFAILTPIAFHMLKNALWSCMNTPLTLMSDIVSGSKSTSLSLPTKAKTLTLASTSPILTSQIKFTCSSIELIFIIFVF